MEPKKYRDFLPSMGIELSLDYPIAHQLLPYQVLLHIQHATCGQWCRYFN